MGWVGGGQGGKGAGVEWGRVNWSEVGWGVEGVWRDGGVGGARWGGGHPLVKRCRSCLGSPELYGKVEGYERVGAGGEYRGRSEQ